MLSLKEHFLLNPEITFLNFGSFGACPKEIFSDYQHWQLQLEREPIQFMLKHGPAQLQKSKEALGSFINCDADDIVFTTNPSYAMNIVAASLQLKPGDEILTTDLEYGAMDRTWNFHSKKNGYTYKRQPIRLPLLSKEDFINQFWQGLTDRTKVIFISQITSSTALILPAEEICARAKELGLLVIVDGAHVPGHIPLNLSKLQADIYTGACHKWMLTPKGNSFLYANKKSQAWMNPLVVSWGYESVAPSNSKFQDYHQQQGTRDFSAFLTIPAALEFRQKHQWEIISSDCKKLVTDNIERFAKLLNTQPLAPITNDFYGQMCSLEIKSKQPEALKQELYSKYQIEIPIMVHDNRVYIRYSINAFNNSQDLDKLYAALSKIIAENKLITS